MPRRALRCSVELQIHAITCPGIYLPHRSDVYVSVHLFGESRKTQLISPTFPLLFHEKFRVNKVFYTAFEPSQVASNLEIEPLTIELIQMTGPYGRVLASYTTNAKDFLYPYPVASYSYGTQDRDVLMDRSIEFPGIAPKLEFSTKTKITETSTPTLDIYEDLNLVGSLEDEPGYSRSPRMSRSARRSRTRTRSPRARRNRPQSATRGSLRYRRSTVASACRCRSASPDRLAGRLSSLGLDDQYEVYDDEPKPPFVVRHCDSAKLIGRKPGTIGANDRRRSSRSAGRRAAQVYGPGSSGYASGGYTSLDDDYVVRGSRTEPLNYSYYSDDDRAGYDDRYVASKYGRRIRAASPVTFREPLAVRFDEPRAPRYSDTITTTVDSAVRHNRYTSPTRLHSSYQNQEYLDRELEDLKIDLELARTRRLIEDEERERRRMFPGISQAHHAHHAHHRDHFNNKLYNSSSDIYGPRKTPFYA